MRQTYGHFRDENLTKPHSLTHVVFITAIAAYVTLEDINIIHFNTQQGTTSTTVEKLKGVQREANSPHTLGSYIFLKTKHTVGDDSSPLERTATKPNTDIFLSSILVHSSLQTKSTY